MRKMRKVWHVIVAIAIVIAVICVVMLLWNWLIPPIIGWSSISFAQAAGLLLLCKLLFGGFGGHHRRFHHKHKGHLHGMTKDEKREFIRGWMNKKYQENDAENT